MNSLPLRFKIVAVVLTLFMTFLSLNDINGHSYTTGFSNFHYDKCPIGITCCFGTPIHASYNCGRTFHL